MIGFPFRLLTWLPDQKFQNQIRTCQLLRRDKLMNTLSLVSMSYPVPNIFALYLNHPATWTKVLPCLKFVSWSVGRNFAVCILVWNTNWADLSNLVIYDVSCQWHGFKLSIRFCQKTRRCLQIASLLAFSVLADCIVHLAAVVPATQAQIVRIQEQTKCLVFWFALRAKYMIRCLDVLFRHK